MTTETIKRLCVLLVSLLIAGFVLWKGHYAIPLGSAEQPAERGWEILPVMTSLFALMLTLTGLSFFARDPDFSE
ncbi:MAG: hypothetical protein AAGD32_10400 [Planctomycetota bacterium]